jgi:hypothetical protein
MKLLSYLLILLHILVYTSTKLHQQHIQQEIEQIHPDRAQKLTFYQFNPQPYHNQYIKDSIQLPAPYLPIKISTVTAPLSPNIKGLTEQIETNHYLIILSPYWLDRDHTYMHELVHVKQLVRKDLKKVGNIWYWKSKPIDWLTPYYDRPWEQEAERQAHQYEAQYNSLGQ